MQEWLIIIIFVVALILILSGHENKGKGSTT